MHKDKDRDERRQLLKAELIEKIVMSNYGKTRYYRISDIIFKHLDEVLFEHDGKQISIVEYY